MQQAWQQQAQPRAEALLKARNTDGSWPYREGPGLTEATCYALLAQKVLGAAESEVAKSLDWLRTMRRGDGGYAPQAAVTESNWTTALAALVFGLYGRSAEQRGAVEWLLGTQGDESKWLYTTLRSMFGVKTAYPMAHHGWPWLAGTNAWVMPTSLGTLALLHAGAMASADAALANKIKDRLGDAEMMLVDRRCQDGGWNHGAPAALEVNANSYPETTGIALLALQRLPADRIQGSDDLAKQMLAKSRYAGSASWLELGLNARSVAFQTGEETAIECRNTLDFSLRILALAAIGGNNILKA